MNVCTNGKAKVLTKACTTWKCPLIMPQSTTYLIPGKGHRVQGETYKVDNQMLKFLDVFDSHHVPESSNQGRGEGRGGGSKSGKYHRGEPDCPSLRNWLAWRSQDGLYHQRSTRLMKSHLVLVVHTVKWDEMSITMLNVFYWTATRWCHWRLRKCLFSKILGECDWALWYDLLLVQARSKTYKIYFRCFRNEVIPDHIIAMNT